MNKIFFLILFFIGNYSFSQELPSTVLRDLDGSSINLQTLIDSENVVVLNFWATWCVPCINELDAISEVYEDWVDETQVKLIAIATDDTRTKKRIRPLVNGKGWEYLVVYDDNQDLKRALNITSLPHTLILKNQKIIQRRIGYSPGAEDELYEIIKNNSN
ncbi:MAG: TlpA family protein disulfide reductase [Bacteroidia bacterium]